MTIPAQRTQSKNASEQFTIQKYIYSDIVFYLRKTVNEDSRLFHIRK